MEPGIGGSGGLEGWTAGGDEVGAGSSYSISSWSIARPLPLSTFGTGVGRGLRPLPLPGDDPSTGVNPGPSDTGLWLPSTVAWAPSHGKEDWIEVEAMGDTGRGEPGARVPFAIDGGMGLRVGGDGSVEDRIGVGGGSGLEAGVAMGGGGRGACPAACCCLARTAAKAS